MTSVPQMASYMAVLLAPWVDPSWVAVRVTPDFGQPHERLEIWFEPVGYGDGTPPPTAPIAPVSSELTTMTSQDLRAVTWTAAAEGGAVPSLSLIDQTALPHALNRLDVTTVDQLIDAIVRLVVRGAPAIGAAGGYGVALAMAQGEREGWDRARLDAEVARVRAARPTAVNLMVCVDRVAPLIDAGLPAVLAEADAIVREDLEANHAMGAFGADWLLKRVPAAVDRPLRILTHCNTGALATAGWGTALGVIRELHGRGRLETVYADETRPCCRARGSPRGSWCRRGYRTSCRRTAPPRGRSCGVRWMRRSSGRTGSRRTATRPTRSARWGSRWRARTRGSRSWWQRRRRRSISPRRRVRTSTSNSGARTRCWSGRASARHRASSRGHNPAFDVTPGSLVTALVTERGVLEVSAGELPEGGLS